MNKRVISLLLIASLVFAIFAGCAPSAPAPAAPAPAAPAAAPGAAAPAAAPAAPAGEQEWRIFFSLPPIANAFHAHMRTLIDEAIAEVPPNFSFTAINAIDDSDQINQVQVAINEGYDLIGIMPNNGTLMAPIAMQAYDLGIPTVIFNRAIEGDRYTHFVTGDNFGGGYMGGEFLAELLGGVGDVVLIRSNAGTPIDMDRSEGFKAAIARFPGMNLIAEPDGSFNREAGFAAMENTLAAFERIDGVFGQDCEAVAGAMGAIAAAGRTDIQNIVAMGAGRPNFELYLEYDPDLILRGHITYFPTMGPEAVRRAVRILQGYTYPKDYLMPSFRVTHENVRDFMGDTVPDFG